MEPPPVYTVGHSNQSLEELGALLRRHGVAALVDVRSFPHSKFSPQFNRETLGPALSAQGLRYAFLGEELGGRPRGDEFYDETGRVLYDRLARSPLFLHGITRLEKSRLSYRLALLCSEEDPGGCHRRLLIGRVLADRGVPVAHIRGDGRLQTEAELVAENAGSSSPQLALFEPVPEESAWRSVRSVSRRSPPPPSSGR